MEEKWNDKSVELYFQSQAEDKQELVDNIAHKIKSNLDKMNLTDKMKAEIIERLKHIMKL